MTPKSKHERQCDPDFIKFVQDTWEESVHQGFVKYNKTIPKMIPNGGIRI